RPVFEEATDVPRPAFAFGPQTHDRDRQYTAGLGYEMLWRGVGELTLGVQRTDYRKEGLSPAGALPVSESRPWLYNGAFSVYLGEALVLYGSYSRGLEESPVAPEAAVNRDTAPPAILTEQLDFGLRYSIAENLRLVVGAFEVRKPFFGLDRNFLFRDLGGVRHRGLEFSLAGSLLPRLYLLAGTIFLDARVSGDAVDQGLIADRPIGSIARTTVAYAQYSFVRPNGLSVDLTFESTSDRVADNLGRFTVPARSVFNLGARYRFTLGRAPATLRVQLANVFDNYGFNVLGGGFYYNFPRRLTAALTADF
ncbi:MAG: TonB-dependent receptor, partial [Sphingomonas sp.]